MTKRMSMPIVVCAAMVILICSNAFAITINFDGTGAPLFFSNAVMLTELYASQGVHFSGPGGLNGGTILNVAGGWRAAYSGTDFLAFSDYGYLSGGGVAIGPETITFDAPMKDVSIYVSGNMSTDTFTMSAYNTANELLDTETLNAYNWSLLSVSSTAPITKVVLQHSGDSGFMYDDLSFTFVPEPSSIIALLGGLGSLLALRRRKA